VDHLLLILGKVTSKRQVTFPAAVLEALGAGPGMILLLTGIARHGA
jgi:bifunctional DNA-binding transcriptional regulator/antitoxin component of YhaV-PrlF toxin-antitoxin module